MIPKLFHNLSNTASVIFCIIFLAVGFCMYVGNMQLFSAIFKYIRLSGRSGLYERTVGQITRVTINMYQTSSRRNLFPNYDLSMNYKFTIDGNEYFGANTFNTPFSTINNAIRKCQKRYPNQKIHLIIKPDSARKLPPDFDEYKAYLKFMDFDYKPSLNSTPINILYNKIHPEENCLESETTLSNIVLTILGIMLITLFTSLLFAAFIPGGNSFLHKYLILVAFLLTAIIPGYFIKPTFNNSNHSPIKKEDIILFDIVVDQNNSEEYLKEQIYQQKMKHQNQE